MQITKFGHCCLLIEENNLRILTDPGDFTTEQNQLKDLDIILITHEHADHLHVESLKQVIANNPTAQVITNTAVGAILDSENIEFTLLSNGESKKIKESVIEAFESPHALLHSTLPQILNTGFFINNKLFYPGDSYIDPGKSIGTLALPVAGPWAKISDVVDYALTLKPKRAFPVHDGGLKIAGGNHKVPEIVLNKAGIEFFVPELGKPFEA